MAAEFASDALRKARYEGWGDFRSYYTAAHALRQGRDCYDRDAMNEVAAWYRMSVKASCRPSLCGASYLDISV